MTTAQIKKQTLNTPSLPPQQGLAHSLSNQNLIKVTTILTFMT